MKQFKHFSLILAPVCMLFWFSSCETAKEEPFKEGYFRNLSDSTRYVGQETCRKCHQDKFDSFVHTEMGRSMEKALLSNSSANFHKAKPVYDKNLNLYYRPFSDGELLYIQEYRLDENNDTVHNYVRKIDFIVGSGHHTNSHLMVENGYVYQMPLTFYTQKKQWDLPPGFENGSNSRFSRYIGDECMTCHNGYAEFYPNSKNRFDKIPEGIDCERCHGPGEIHVLEKLDGKLVDVTKQTDYSIVNPSKLGSDLAMDVCQRCHLQGISALQKGKSFYDFKPGQKLSDTYELYQARFKDSDKAFIMAAHPDRLKMSKCFTESNNALTCITCHNPHISVKDVKQEFFDQKCISCHKEKVCTEKKTTDCVKCHMSKASSYDIPHVSITDHKIARRPQPRAVSEADYAQSEWEKQKDFLQLVCLTNPKPKAYSTAKAYLNYYEKYAPNALLLDSAFKYIQRANEDELLIHYYFLKKDYEKIISNSYSNNLDSWSDYRIGEAYSQTGNKEKALEFYQKAVQKAQMNLDFRNKYASILLELERQDAAKKVLELSLVFNSEIWETNNLMGFALVLEEEYSRSEGYFVKAHLLAPDELKPLENLTSLYIKLGEKEKAQKHLKKLLLLDTSNPDYLKMKKIVDIL